MRPGQRRLRGPTVLVTLLGALLWLLALTGAEAPGAGPAPPPLKLGIHPYLPAQEVHGRFAPLARYLEDRLGRRVIVSVAPDYMRHIQDVGEGLVDIAYVGSASYVKLVDDYGFVPVLAGMQIRGRRMMKGVIVTGPLTAPCTLADMRGMRFAFGDENSTTSYVMPRYTLEKAGVRLRDLRSYEYLQNHENIVMGVLMGDFDAGAIKLEVYEEYEGRGLRLVAETPVVAEYLFVAAPFLAEEDVAAIREAMQGIAGTREGLEALGHIRVGATGLVPARDEEYDSLRSYMRAIGLF